MKQYKKILSLIAAAALTAAAPMQVLAENPEFAHDSATWAKLRDNTMEYDELPMLVEEYNADYMNNQVNYKNSKSKEDAQDNQQDLQNSATDMYDQADDFRDRANGLLDLADSLQGMSKDQMNAALSQAGMKSVSSLMSAYSAMISGAAMMDNKALNQQMTADSAYEDDNTRKLKYLKNQDSLVVSVQSLYDSYNQMKHSMGVMEKNVEVLKNIEAATELKLAKGLATQTDVLTAKKNVQSMESNYTQSQASLESARQKLCIMTGWAYDAKPDIQDVPAADVSRIASMNPDTDLKQALDNNYDLKYNSLVHANMTLGTTDEKNMARTINNQKETITANFKNLYNDVLQKKTALDLANAALEAETATMSGVENKYKVGLASQLDYLQEQANYMGKQVDQHTADAALFQAMETYDWAKKGFMNSGA